MKMKSGSEIVHLPCTVRLMDGTLLSGTVNCGLTGKLDALLTKDNAFVEFTSRDGQQRFITRHQIASIEPTELVKPPTLPDTEAANADPFLILGVPENRTMEGAREGYLRLTKIYHPDRWAGEDIPSEISKYAADKTRQINAAYTDARVQIQEADRQRKQSAINAAGAAAQGGFGTPTRMFGDRS